MILGFDIQRVSFFSKAVYPDLVIRFFFFPFLGSFQSLIYFYVWTSEKDISNSDDGGRKGAVLLGKGTQKETDVLGG